MQESKFNPDKLDQSGQGAEFLDYQKQRAEERQAGFGLDQKGTELADETAKILQFPQAKKPDQKTEGELSDLAEEILKQLEGKTDKEKIEALLNGNYDPSATSEAMAEIWKHQKVA